MIAITNYKPGRFFYLEKEPFFSDLWKYLACDERIDQMISAINQNKPAISLFLTELETIFGKYLASKKYPHEDICVLANNMMKQILAIKGYEHVACGICPTAKYIKQSGMYEKM